MPLLAAADEYFFDWMKIGMLLRWRRRHADWRGTASGCFIALSGVSVHVKMLLLVLGSAFMMRVGAADARSARLLRAYCWQEYRHELPTAITTCLRCRSPFSVGMRVAHLGVLMPIRLWVVTLLYRRQKFPCCTLARLQRRAAGWRVESGGGLCSFSYRFSQRLFQVIPAVAGDGDASMPLLMRLSRQIGRSTMHTTNPKIIVVGF